LTLVFDEEPVRSAERLAESLDALARHVSSLTWSDLPTPVRSRLELMLTDLTGVTLAGLGTPELRALIDHWHLPRGDVPVLGTSIRTTAATSGHLSAVAACVLELDEGNKYAGGHPAAHVVFAALVAALESPAAVSGERFLTAVAAGYEVAARFGRATRRHPEWHPHGNWGVTGAAAASALVLGATPQQVAAAIDASTGLMQVTPWGTVLGGDFTRNLWMAGANLAGVQAARLALAGLVHNSGAGHYSLGSIVGTLDAELLTDDLGRRWLINQGYLKRHSSCSFTHAAVDMVQTLRATRPWSLEDVSAVRVSVHSLARPLFGRHPESRLAAMFSLPFVVASAMVSGSIDPLTMSPGSEPYRDAEQFCDRVHVEVSDGLDACLPDRRCTELTIEFADGTWLGLGQPNPVGDADYFPLTADDVRSKLVSLVGASATRRVEDAVRDLPDAASVSALFMHLAP
jgi:2-methylcitrate dehydratase PrpD